MPRLRPRRNRKVDPNDPLVQFANFVNDTVVKPVQNTVGPIVKPIGDAVGNAFRKTNDYMQNMSDNINQELSKPIRRRRGRGKRY